MTSRTSMLDFGTTEFAFTDTVFEKLEDLLSHSQSKTVLMQIQALLDALNYLHTKGSEGNMAGVVVSVSADSKVFLLGTKGVDLLFIQDKTEPKKLVLADVIVRSETLER